MSQITPECGRHSVPKIAKPGGGWRCRQCVNEENARSSAKRSQKPCGKCGSPRTEYRRNDGMIYRVCLSCKANRYADQSARQEADGFSESFYQRQSRLEKADAERIRLEIAAERLAKISADGIKLHDQRELVRREWERKAREQRSGVRFHV